MQSMLCRVTENTQMQALCTYCYGQACVSHQIDTWLLQDSITCTLRMYRAQTVTACDSQQRPEQSGLTPPMTFSNSTTDAATLLGTLSSWTEQLISPNCGHISRATTANQLHCSYQCASSPLAHCPRDTNRTLNTFYQRQQQLCHMLHMASSHC